MIQDHDLSYIDRELVYPTALDKIVPHWVNHALHTTWVGNR